MSLDLGASVPIRLYIAHQADVVESIRDQLAYVGRLQVVGGMDAGHEALAEIAKLRPDVVLADALLMEMSLADFIKKVKEVSPAAVIALSYQELSTQVKANCYTFGALDVLVSPSLKKLETTIIHVYDLDQAAKAPTGGLDELMAPEEDTWLGSDVFENGPSLFNPEQIVHRGKIIAVYAPKNGVGVSHVALNLASAQAEVTGEEVCLVDFDLQSGEIDLILELPSDKRHTVTAVTEASPSSVDETVLLRALRKAPNGVSVLAAPIDPEDTSNILPGQLQQILAILRERFRYVFVVVGSGLNAHTIGVLDDVDTILVVTVPEVTSLRNTLLFLEVAGSLEYSKEKVRLTLNQSDAKAEKEVELEEIRNTLLKGRDFLARLSEAEQGPALLFQGNPASDKLVERRRNEFKQLAKALVPASGKEETLRVMGLS